MRLNITLMIPLYIIQASDCRIVSLPDEQVIDEEANKGVVLQAGIHPKVVSERLGHSTVSITLDTYSHAVPALQVEAAEKVASVVFGRAG